MFFVLGGYVCAIKPLRLARTDQADEARKTIASMAFRRLWRIGVPSAMAIIISFILAQTGAFGLVPAVQVEGDWLVLGTPEKLPGLIAPVLFVVKSYV